MVATSAVIAGVISSSTQYSDGNYALILLILVLSLSYVIYLMIEEVWLK